MPHKIERRPRNDPGQSRVRLTLLVGAASLVLWGWLFVPGTALGQDFAAAGRHFAAAQDAFGQDRFSQAAKEYQAAYEITKDPVLLFNIGESFQRAGDGPQAIRSYRAYLQAQPTASDRPEVERRLNELEAAGGAPGPTGVTGATGTQQPGADTTKQPAVPESGASAAKGNPPSGYRTAAWAGVAATVALVTAGAVLGLAAQSRADELYRRTTQTVAGQPPPVFDGSQSDAYQALLSDGRAYNSAAIACFAVGGAAAVTSAVLFLYDWRKRPRAEASMAQFLEPGPRLGVWSF